MNIFKALIYKFDINELIGFNSSLFIINNKLFFKLIYIN